MPNIQGSFEDIMKMLDGIWILDKCVRKGKIGILSI